VQVGVRSLQDTNSSSSSSQFSCHCCAGWGPRPANTNSSSNSGNQSVQPVNVVQVGISTLRTQTGRRSSGSGGDSSQPSLLRCWGQRHVASTSGNRGCDCGRCMTSLAVTRAVAGYTHHNHCSA
jgi:hypothetical protein